MAPKLKKSLEAGRRFIDYLKEKNEATESDRNKLKEIYNSDFRNRDGEKHPNFSSVLYALARFRKVVVHSGCVYIGATRREVCRDQWKTSHRQQQPSVAPVEPSTSVALASSLEVPPGLQKERHGGWPTPRDLKEKRDEYTANKMDIEVTSDDKVVDGVIQLTFSSVPAVCTVKLYIKNTGASLKYFTRYTIQQEVPCLVLKDDRNVTPTHPRELTKGSSYEIGVEFRVGCYGFYSAVLVFEFKPDLAEGSRPFHIVRFLEASVEGDLEGLGPSKPYRPLPVPKRSQKITVVVEGEKPDRLDVNDLITKTKLGDYPSPRYLPELIKILKEMADALGMESEIQVATDLLQSPLSFQNYCKRFQLLLHLEEDQMNNDIEKYKMTDVTMTGSRNKKLLVLDVPGVAENRPSVLRGDYLLASKANDTKVPLPLYKGYVHSVEFDQVLLGFSSKLLQSFINNMKFNVEFKFSRLTMRLQHRAVELAVQYKLGEVLFPTACSAEKVTPHTLSFCNKILEKNPEQYTAVQHIVTGASRPAPYLVFGPPGTGKTVTLVEAVKQVLKSDPSAHVLVSAPSNAASDLLCEHLLDHLKICKVFRMYASSCSFNDMPAKLEDCCNWKDRCVEFPCKEKLMEYRVLVTTLFTAGRLVTGGLPPGHFTHIFVDEAGQATEPESIIGIAGLLRAGTGQVVLAGDPKQLGPILRSPLAIKYGLGLSLLERLISRHHLYKKNPKTEQFDTRCIVKLLRNYRSHPAILKIPNELFYEDELQVHADEILRNSYCNWEHLPIPGFPVIFHGVQGKDQREGSSPSFFNVTEIEVIVSYLKKLLLGPQGKKGQRTITVKHIGIIAPYRKQVQKIRQAIRNCDKELKKIPGIETLKVGSVEEFQGQERTVILISTVRSNVRYTKMDRDFCIGFLNNEKRFNVAVTRAKALLIVVGNPIILNKDPTWRRFIQYCTENRGYKGIDYRATEGDDDIVCQLASLTVKEPGEVETKESAIQQHNEPEWRNEM